MSDQPPGIAELDERIPFLLAQLGSYISDDFQHRLAPVGADPRTYAVLVALASDDGQSQRQLSARLGRPSGMGPQTSMRVRRTWRTVRPARHSWRAPRL
jgi:hypothetical protein